MDEGIVGTVGDSGDTEPSASQEVWMFHWYLELIMSKSDFTTSSENIFLL